MNDGFRCLAVQQPWAWALCAGVKTVENRTWTTRHRGPVVIVASAKKRLVNELRRAAGTRVLRTSVFAFGAAIGVVDLIDVQPLRQALETDPWARGPFCWLVGNGRFFDEPVPCKARLNLYAAEGDVAERVRRKLKSARAARDPEGVAWMEVAREHFGDRRLEALADSYAELGDAAGLERIASAGLERHPGSGFFLSHLTIALLELDRPREALRCANGLVAAGPDEPSAFYLRGRVHEALGNAGEAQKDFARVRKLAPDFEFEAAQESEEEDER